MTATDNNLLTNLKKLTGMALNNKVQGICMLSFHIHITR